MGSRNPPPTYCDPKLRSTIEQAVPKLGWDVRYGSFVAISADSPKVRFVPVADIGKRIGLRDGVDQRTAATCRA